LAGYHLAEDCNESSLIPPSEWGRASGVSFGKVLKGYKTERFSESALHNLEIRILTDLLIMFFRGGNIFEKHEASLT